LILTAGARRYAMVILTVVYMFNFIDRTILAILLPAIRDEFKVSDTVLGLLAGPAFVVFYVILGIPIAQFADRSNRRNVVALALAVWSGMTAISGLALNIWHLTLARIGVGIGEAGCSPPAHSMIADLYPPEQRSTAMGFYTLGISAGIMLASLVGGWVAENIGWREAFFIVGIPGVLLALLMRLTVVEPDRGASERRVDSGRRPSLLEVMRFLLQRRSSLHMGIAAGLSAFAGYSVINWMPSFIYRSFGIGYAEIGFWLGIIVGTFGGIGFFFGGFIADRIGKGGQRRAFRFLAVSMVFAAAANAVVFLSPSIVWCLALFVIPTIISNFYLAPVLAQTQGLVSLRMRAMASALVLLVINIIGLGLGPLVTGILSDLLTGRIGSESKRYSLLIVCVVVLPGAGWHYYRAGQTLESDLARATEDD
jgi:MFS family permease